MCIVDFSKQHTYYQEIKENKNKIYKLKNETDLLFIYQKYYQIIHNKMQLLSF